jgi:hypothetical protein
MTIRQVSIALVWLLGVTHAAMAQSAGLPPAAVDDGRDRSATSSPAPVDVSRLPIDMRRIQREFREASMRGERDGLNLRYFVEVYGQAPPLVFFTKEDNLRYGPVPHGAPTHRDILWMITPPAHRGSLYALPLFRIPIGDSRKGN